MIRAIGSLARHRLAGRAGATILLLTAVAAATGLGGTIRVLGLGATDAAVGEALARLDPADRAVRITGYAPSNAESGRLADAAGSAVAATTMFADDAVAGIILRRARDAGAPYDLQIVGTDGLGAWVETLEGRLPAPCDGTACEAVLLAAEPAPTDLPTDLHVAGLEIRVVGRGLLTSSIPLGHLDERGPQRPPLDPTAQEPDPAPALLLVEGASALAGSPGAGAVGRTYLWTAPLRASTIHPWTDSDFEAALAAARRGLAVDARDLVALAPSEAIREALVRGAVNDGRLLLIGTLGVAILVAFVGYAALLGRRDLRAELERLASSGAGRPARSLLVILEVLVPTTAGTMIGWAGAAVVGRFVVGTAEAADPGGVVSHALGDPASLTIAGLVLAASTAAILAGLFGIARRELVAGLVPGGLAFAGFIAWRLVATGGLGAPAVGSLLDAPVLAAIPAIVGIIVAAAALATVPVILRRLAGTRRHRSVPTRLALLALARDPIRPAATITLLAFGIGGLVFAIADAATLRQGIDDEAAYRVGMDLRVTEAPSGLTLTPTVAPFSRYEHLGNGVVAMPVAHVAATAGSAGDVTLAGLPPSALPLLRGWRDDLDADPAKLAAAIDVPGEFAVPGVPLPADASRVEVTVTHVGDPVYLSVVVATPSGDAGRIFLGTLRGSGRETRSAPLPPDAKGGRIIGLIISEGRLIAGSQHPGGLARATLTFEGLDPVVGPGPVSVEVNGVTPAILRSPLATDDLVLPAVVGPSLADAARHSADGTVLLTLGDRDLVRIRVAGVMPRFPGLPDAGGAFAVVDLDPLLAALDGASPGAGRPDEAWLRVDDPAELDRVRVALAGPPFRTATIQSRTALEVAAQADPFARAVLAAIAAAGAAGLLLAALGLALGAMADVRDETGELRDLEAQGLGPRALRRQVGARTLLLAAAGTSAGMAMGLALAVVVTVAVGVGAAGGTPLLPLELVLPWPGLTAAAAVPMVAAGALAALAAMRAFRAPARMRDQA